MQSAQGSMAPAGVSRRARVFAGCSRFRLTSAEARHIIGVRIVFHLRVYIRAWAGNAVTVVQSSASQRPETNIGRRELV